MLKKTNRATRWAAVLTMCSVISTISWRRLNTRANGDARPVPLADGFDGVRAFEDLKHIVDFGPRPSGSKNLEQARRWIVHQLQGEHLTVETDSFVALTPIGSIPMTNIIAKIPGASPSIVVIGGHYDTKRMAAPFFGANDGGSSAAFLLEMARIPARRTNELTYWLVFFDGEEAVQRWSATDSLYGSRHFADTLSGHHMRDRIKAALVVDMIADVHLQIRPEAHSTPWLNDLVWNEANRLGYQRYFLHRPRTIDDDHLPFLKRGIPAVDIIDLDYGPLNLYWHTRYDTLDRCSAASVGDRRSGCASHARCNRIADHARATLQAKGERQCILPTRSFGVRPPAQDRRLEAKSIRRRKKPTALP